MAADITPERVAELLRDYRDCIEEDCAECLAAASEATEKAEADILQAFAAAAEERDRLRVRVAELERMVEAGPVPPACSVDDWAAMALEHDKMREERDRLRAELQQCEKVSHERFAYACRLEAAEDKLDQQVDRLRAQRDALVAAGEPVADALRDIAGDGHRVYLDQWEAAVSAVEEATES